MKGETVTAPDGREAQLLQNPIVVRAVASQGTFVASTEEHAFYLGRTPGSLIAIPKP